VEKGTTVLMPRKLVFGGQAWFWTKRWQAMERAARKDLEGGRVTEAPSMKELLRKLKK
jgi:hypothetical protein